jgi:hypothetical protein
VQTTFDLTGFIPSTAELVMSIWADNAVHDIKLNGVSTGLSLIHPAATAFNFAGGKTFSVNSGFVSGINTLEFLLVNDPPAGPTGLRIDLSGTAMLVPEPGTMTLLLIGVALAAVARRRRSK